MATKNDLHQLSDFLKFSLAVMVEVVDLALRAVTGVFKIYTINSFIKKKNKKIEINFIMSKVLFGKHNQNESKNTFIIIKGSVSHINHFFNKISPFKHKPLFKIFTFAMIF